MKLRLMAGAAATALLLGACGGAGGGAGGQSGATTLVFGSLDRGESLDAATAYVGWTNNREGITETLVDVDAKLNLIPKLATEWKNVDDKTWKIKLRDGVTFHNGKSMDGAAVKASLEYSIQTNVRAQAQLPVESITAEGQEVTIVTSKPVAALPSVLADPMMGIQALGEGIDPAKDPQGTGPFSVTEFVPKQKLELDAHKGYWGGEPKLKHLTWRSYADSQAMALAMQSGEIQLAVQPDASGLKVFSDTNHYTTWQVTSTRGEAAILNAASPVTGDPKVREALNYAMDREAYPQVMNGMGKGSYTLFPENVAFGGTEGRTPKVTAKDLQKAKQLLLEAGYSESEGQIVKDGKPLTIRVLTYPRRPQLGQMAQLLQADLKTIGVSVEITELKSTSEQMKSGEFEVGMYSFAMAPTGDAQYYFETVLRTGAESNFSHYASPAFDQAVDELAAVFTPEERLAKSRAVEQIVLDEMPYVVFGHAQWWVISTPKVQGLSVLPTEYHLFTHETHVG